MKIAFFCEGFNKQKMVAQPWRHIYEIAKRIREQGNEVWVLTDRSAKNAGSCDKIESMPICEIEKRKGFLDVSDFVEKTERIGAEMINWHGGPLSTIYFQRLPKTLKPRIVWTIYKGEISFRDIKNLRFADIMQLREFWSNFLYSLCPKTIVRKGAEVDQVRRTIAMSNRLRTYLENIGVAKSKIAVISSGVDTRRFQPLQEKNLQIRKRLGFCASDPIVLYFGPISRFRGSDTLISAMPLILRKVPSAKLLLLARKLETSKSGEIARPCSWMRVLEGIQQNDSLVQYLNLADVVVLPFRFWPHIEVPLTVLESMAVGKPLITTTTGALPEIVQDGETGFLVSPGKPEEIAEKVIDVLLNQRLAKEIGRNAWRYVQEFHDWDVIAKQTLEVFQACLQDSSQLQ